MRGGEKCKINQSSINLIIPHLRNRVVKWHQKPLHWPHNPISPIYLMSHIHTEAWRGSFDVCVCDADELFYPHIQNRLYMCSACSSRDKPFVTEGVRVCWHSPFSFSHRHSFSALLSLLVLVIFLFVGFTSHHSLSLSFSHVIWALRPVFTYKSKHEEIVLNVAAAKDTVTNVSILKSN